MVKNTAKLFIVIAYVLCSFALQAAEHPEQRVLQALEAVQAAQLDKAQSILQQLTHDEPEFKLAQLMYADILKAKTGSLSKAGMDVKDTTQLEQLLIEIKTRWKAKASQVEEQKIPAVLTRMDDYYLNAIVVDLKQSRLFVFENRDGQPKKVADYFVSMGRGGPRKQKQGDLRTPLGVYFVQSYIPPNKLADKYGSGAFPINYPNAWDSFNQRTGNGIWLHGTRSGTYNRPSLASEGCVVLPNDDLVEVGSFITLGQTPFLIGDDIDWLSKGQWQQQQQQVNSMFTRWLDDWQSLNTDNYLSHYSKNFSNGKMDFARWVKHKRRVAQLKTFVQVEASDVSLLMHPNEDVMVATFHQKYQSDNFIGQSWKRQYWHKEDDGQWRIIFEGKISAPSVQQLARRSL